MNILITLGTSPFPSLISFLSKNTDKLKGYEVVIQGFTSGNIPSRFEHIEYVQENFIGFIQKFDMVITHAGAGTIYNLLENDIRFACVPNFDFKDQHQKEIANYLKKENLAKIIFDFSDLFEIIKNWDSLVFNKYKKISFDCNAFVAIL